MARPKKTEAPSLADRVNLTAGAIERLTCPPGKQQAFLRDSEAPGLRVRVTAAGAKSFVYESKLNRQTIRRTIGDVKLWSIEQARTEARRVVCSRAPASKPDHRCCPTGHAFDRRPRWRGPGAPLGGRQHQMVRLDHPGQGRRNSHHPFDAICCISAICPTPQKRLCIFKRHRGKRLHRHSTQPAS